MEFFKILFGTDEHKKLLALVNLAVAIETEYAKKNTKPIDCEVIVDFTITTIKASFKKAYNSPSSSTRSVPKQTGIGENTSQISGGPGFNPGMGYNPNNFFARGLPSDFIGNFNPNDSNSIDNMVGHGTLREEFDRKNRAILTLVIQDGEFPTYTLATSALGVELVVITKEESIQDAASIILHHIVMVLTNRHKETPFEYREYAVEFANSTLNALPILANNTNRQKLAKMLDVLRFTLSMPEIALKTYTPDQIDNPDDLGSGALDLYNLAKMLSDIPYQNNANSFLSQMQTAFRNINIHKNDQNDDDDKHPSSSVIGRKR